MKKICCTFLSIFSVSGLVFSLSGCSMSQHDPEPERNEFNIELSSHTLEINRKIARKNEDFSAIISLKQSDYNYCLPKGISLYVGQQYIESSQYDFDSTTGNLIINKELITDNISIYGESKLKDGYQIRCDVDKHVHFLFYKNRDYSQTPIENTVAIARDQYGEITKDGTGEINFKFQIDNNYDTDLLWRQGIADDAIEVPGEPGIYRISNIGSNLNIYAKTKEYYCKNLHASCGVDSFNFKWEIRDPSKIDYINVEIWHNNELVNEHVDVDQEYNYGQNIVNGDLYIFIFTPVFKDGTMGDPVTKEMMLAQQVTEWYFPRVDISTEDSLLPQYSIATGPYKADPSVVDAQYVQSIVNIWDNNRECKYDSSADFQSNPFEGAKIKVRGNTSTVTSAGKESYKIKLKKKADLLDPFLNRSSLEDGEAYQHKDWLLLNCGNQLNELAGFSLENSLGVDWVPQCQYVTLFLNNDFKGLYVLCESVSQGNTNDEGTFRSRCPVDNDGFIIENDVHYWKEDISFRTQINHDVNYLQYTFKYPDADKLTYSDERYEYIKNYVQEFENHLYAKELDEEYKNYIDIPSFAKWTVAHDLMHVQDYLGSNMYIYKKDATKNSKLIAGTTWDFDSAFISEDGVSPGLCAHRNLPIYYINLLSRIDEFKQATQDVFNNAKSKIIDDLTVLLGNVIKNINLYDNILQIESKRYSRPQVSYHEQITQINKFLQLQIDYINEHPYVE